MNRGEMREQLGFLLNFNESQVDQAFTAARLNKELQYAYDRIVRRCKQQSSKAWFTRYVDATWTSGSLTYTPPSVALRGFLMLFRMDSTNTNQFKHRIEVGQAFPAGFENSSANPYPYSESANQVFWLDNDTLQWGNDTGPSEDIYLRFVYLAYAETLEDDDDEPSLIPPEHRETIVLEALRRLRGAADGQYESWIVEDLNNAMFDLIKFLSGGRPSGSVQWFDSSAPYPYT